MIHKDTEEYRALQRTIRDTIRGEAKPSDVMLRLLEVMADISENVRATEDKQAAAIAKLSEKLDSLLSKIEPLPLAQLASIIGALQNTGTSGSITLPQRVSDNERGLRDLQKEMITLNASIKALNGSIAGLEKKIEQSNGNSYGSSGINGERLLLGAIAIVFLISILLQIFGGAF